jgi:hypothetical protein
VESEKQDRIQLNKGGQNMAKSGGRSGGRALVPKDDTVLNPVIRDEAGRFIVGAGRWAQNKFADLMISNWRNIESGNVDTGPSQLYEDFNRRETQNKRIEGPRNNLGIGMSFEWKFGGGGGKKPPSDGNNTTYSPNYKGGNSMGYNKRGKGKSNGSGSGNGGGSTYSTDNTRSLGGSTNWPLDMSEGKGISDLNTGIRSGLTSLTQTPEDITHNYTGLFLSPLELTVAGQSNTEAGQVGISNFRGYVFDLVYPLYVQYVQENLNFRETLSTEQFVEYFETVSAAIQVYYSVEPFLNYSQNPDSQNYHMNLLREAIQATEIERLYVLRERIEQMVFPPKMLAWIKWMYQLYSFNTIPGSPICKYVYKQLWQPNNSLTATGEGRLSPNVLNYYISTLLTLSTNGTGAILHQVFNNWKIGQLPMSHPVATYDPQFCTLWSNMGMNGLNSVGNVTRYPSVNSDTENVVYGSYVNVLDGLVPACNTVYNTGTGLYGQGILRIPSDYQNVGTFTGAPCSLWIVNENSTSDDDRTRFIDSTNWQIAIGLMNRLQMSGDHVTNGTSHFMQGMQKFTN